MNNLSGRVDRLERRISGAGDGMIVLTIPYGEDPAQAQARALEAKGLRPSDVGDRLVLFVTSFASA